MTSHSCLLCLGSNFYRIAHMAYARRDLEKIFPDIRFSTEMETETIGAGFLSPFSNQVAWFETSLSSEQVRGILKQIESDNGRLPEEKAHGIVKLDIDLLMYDDCVLKPTDMKKEYVLVGMKELGFIYNQPS